MAEGAEKQVPFCIYMLQLKTAILKAHREKKQEQDAKVDGAQPDPPREAPPGIEEVAPVDSVQMNGGANAAACVEDVGEDATVVLGHQLTEVVEPAGQQQQQQQQQVGGMAVSPSPALPQQPRSENRHHDAQDQQQRGSEGGPPLGGRIPSGGQQQKGRRADAPVNPARHPVSHGYRYLPRTPPDVNTRAALSEVKEGKPTMKPSISPLSSSIFALSADFAEDVDAPPLPPRNQPPRSQRTTKKARSRAARRAQALKKEQVASVEKKAAKKAANAAKASARAAASKTASPTPTSCPGGPTEVDMQRMSFQKAVAPKRADDKALKRADDKALKRADDKALKRADDKATKRADDKATKHADAKAAAAAAAAAAVSRVRPSSTSPAALECTHASLALAALRATALSSPRVPDPEGEEAIAAAERRLADAEKALDKVIEESRKRARKSWERVPCGMRVESLSRGSPRVRHSHVKFYLLRQDREKVREGWGEWGGCVGGRGGGRAFRAL